MPSRPQNREEGWRLPSSLDDLIPSDHAVRFVAAYVDQLEASDWRQLGITLKAKERGAPRYHPAILLSVWLWGFMQGVRSARKLEAACREIISYRWLTGQQLPDHNTLWRFYQAHRAGMRYLLTHTVQTAVRTGLVDLAVQAVDGTKLPANASKDRFADAAKLDRLIERVERAIADLEAQNATGGDAAPPRLPTELASKEALVERMQQLRSGVGERSRVNLTDRDARLMKGRSGYIAGYNAQAMAAPLDAAAAGGPGILVTASMVSTQGSDQASLLPMMTRAARTTGSEAAVTLADGGYHSGANLAAVSARDRVVVMPEAQTTLGTAYHKDQFVYDADQDTYRCPEGASLTRQGTNTRGRTVYREKTGQCRSCPAFGTCTRNRRHGRTLQIGPHDAALQRHRAWMQTQDAKTLYARRKSLIEPVFGIMKEQRGGRRFLLRGLKTVGCEWALMSTAFNLRVLAQIWQRGALCLPA